MKRLLVAVGLLLGLALAQPYAGGHVGLFGQAVNLGVHLGGPYGSGVTEARVGLDTTFAAGVAMFGLNADTLYVLSLPAVPVAPYLGAGSNLWLVPGVAFGYGLHATLGLRLTLPGVPLRGFAEFQPVYIYLFDGNTGVGGVGFLLKVGGDVAL